MYGLLIENVLAYLRSSLDAEVYASIMQVANLSFNHNDINVKKVSIARVESRLGIVT